MSENIVEITSDSNSQYSLEISTNLEANNNNVTVDLANSSNVNIDIINNNTILVSDLPQGYPLSWTVGELPISRVSGLEIISGSGISVNNNSSGVFTVAVTGQFGLTGEEVDDRISNLIVGTSGISISYNDDNNLLYITTTGSNVIAGSGLVKTNDSIDIVSADSSRIIVGADNIDLAPVTQSDSLGSSSVLINYINRDAYGRILGVRSGPVPNAGLTSLSKGIAFFSSGNFDVIAGGVSLKHSGINIGNTNIVLGQTQTEISGLNTILSDSGNFNTLLISGIPISNIYQPLLSSPVTGVGTNGNVARWIDSNRLSSGSIYDNLSKVTISNPIGLNPTSELAISGYRAFHTLQCDDSGFGLSYINFKTQTQDAYIQFFGKNSNVSVYRNQMVILSSGGLILTTANNFLSPQIAVSESGVSIGKFLPNTQLDVVGTGSFSQNLLVNNIPVSISGHSHLASDITNFSSSVSGLINGIYAPLNSPSFSGFPTVPTANSGNNSTQIANTAFVRSEISSLINSAPSTLDTLNELASALGNDPNFATTVTNNIANKVSKSGDTMTGALTAPTGNFDQILISGIPVSVSGHAHAISDISNLQTSLDTKAPTFNPVFSGTVSGITKSMIGLGNVDNTSDINKPVSTAQAAADTAVQNAAAVDATTKANNAQAYSIQRANHTGTQTSSTISDFNTTVSGLLPVKNISGGSGINISNNSGIYTVAVTGNFGLTSEEVDDRVSALLSAGTGVVLNYDDPNNILTISTSGLAFTSGANFNSLSVTGVPVSLSGHKHLYTDITNFNSGVQDSLTTTLLGGSFINLNYDSSLDTLTISSSGLQPSGNYSVVGHSHVVSDITNFSSGVSGLVSGVYAPLNSPNFIGIPTAPTAASGTSSNQIANTAFVRTEISNLVSSAPSTLDTLNELAAALGNDANFSTTVTNSLATKASLSGASFIGNVSAPTGNFTVLQQNNINVSVSGHTHLSSNITDFNSAASAAAPVQSVNSLTGSVVINTWEVPDFTIGTFPDMNFYFTATKLKQYIIRNTSTTNNTSITYYNFLDPLNPSGGDYYVVYFVENSQYTRVGGVSNWTAGTRVIRLYKSGPAGGWSNIVLSPITQSDLDQKAPINNPTFTGTVSGITKSMVGLGNADNTSDVNKPVSTAQASADAAVQAYSIQRSNHTGTQSSSTISDFNSSVSGLLPVKNLVGSGYINVISNTGLYTISTSGLQPSGNYSVVGHSHTTSDITDFNSSVSGLLPVKNIISGTDISVTNIDGIYTINSTVNTVSEAGSLVTTVFNKTGSSIPKMSAVYINGGQGDTPTISLAIATGDSTSAGTYGLTYETIPNMSSGKVVVFGVLTGLNTDQFNPTAPQGDVNGRVLYLSPTVSGALTTVKSSAPNHMVAIGTIVRTHQTQGVIEVRVQNGFELEELHNVAIGGVSNGQFLQYNSTSGLWVPTSSGNFTTLLVNNTGVAVSNHTHGNITSSGTIGAYGDKILITDANKVIIDYDYAPKSHTLYDPANSWDILSFTDATPVWGPEAILNDTHIQLRDSIFASPILHSHGNLSSSGTIGSTSGLLVIAGSGGVLTTTSGINSSLITNFNTAVSGLINGIYAPLNSPTFTGNVAGISKTMVGLGNVDNTSDSDKPISNATQIALNNKAALSHTHSSSDITNFNSSVSGLLPVKNILAGSGVAVSGNLGAYTVSVDIIDCGVIVPSSVSLPSLAHYTFNSNVLDSNGSYNGTAFGNPSFVAGYINNAIQLDSPLKYVTIPRPISTNWTVSFFIRTSASSPFTSNWYDGISLLNGEMPGVVNDFGIVYLNNKICVGIGNPDTSIFSTSTINNNSWRHVGVTRNSSTGQIKIYIDGTLETTANGPTGAKSSASTLIIGGAVKYGFFNGLIDNMKIFDSVLTDAQILLLQSGN